MTKKAQKKSKTRKAATPVPEIVAPKSDWVEVRRSDIHGDGLYARKDIPEETQIIQYVGQKISKAEGLKRACALFEKSKLTGGAGVYIFDLNKKQDLDGDFPGNIARLMNHSCDPNCEARQKKGKIWIVALREIKQGEELTFNYGFGLDTWKDHPCRCGTEKCVGYIVSEDHWAELRKILAQLPNSNPIQRYR